MNAWLITWEGTDKWITEANKIAGVLSGRNSSSDIEKLVDFLYHRTIFDVGDMIYYANKKKARQDKSKALSSTSDRIFYGSNPCLYARRVKGLQVKLNESKTMEVVSWVEYARIVNNESTRYKFEEVEPEKAKSISRPINAPVSSEQINA